MRTNNPLKPGHYDIIPYSRRDTIAITDEQCIARILSKTKTSRDESFRARGFEAAHIFPLSSEEYWVQNGFTRWITNRTGERDAGINSCQNGLLMQSNIHQNFDGFGFAVNPDDGYMITCFDKDPFRIDGRTLDPICRSSSGEDGARDELLWWHFRQAVLANMRGAGEPSFEMDFPPGSDMVGEILSGPEAGKRMEAELFSRLNGVSVT
ncbi:hypothetical protein V1504DRAFT_398477 [Lipomyces starkeyi]